MILYANISCFRRKVVLCGRNLCVAVKNISKSINLLTVCCEKMRDFSIFVTAQLYSLRESMGVAGNAENNN